MSVETNGLNESFLDLESIDYGKLVKLQAAWRGTLVRKQLFSLRESFEEICKEVDKRNSKHLIWPRQIPCYPNFISSRDFKNSEKVLSRKLLEAVEKENGEEIFCETVLSPSSKSKKRTTACQTVSTETECLDTEPVVMVTCSPEDSDVNGKEVTCNDAEENQLDEQNEDCPGNRHLSTTELKNKTEELEHDGEKSEDDRCFSDGTEYPEDRDELIKLRKNIAMELLWVQQAINSRKNYLKLKAGME